MNDRPAITPDLKIGQLLEAYPELEDELIAVAPTFEKLRNPVLRRTVAKITTLQQAAAVGGVSLGELIGRLRRAAGLDEPWQDGDAAAEAGNKPAWVDGVEVVSTRDARPEIERGEHPLPMVMAAVRDLQPGQAYVLITPFVPAPMIDKITEMGFLTWTEQAGPEEFRTVFARA